MAQLSETALSDLRSQIWGSVVLPNEKGWAEATHTWTLPFNAEDKLPALVVRPKGILDIKTALKFAQDNNLEIAVKGGGHSVSQLGLVKGGMTLDMSLMRGVIVDPEKRLATAEGGALLGDVDSATGVYGLATTLGFAVSTGLGLAIGGGLGLLCKLFGTTCENIEGATVVLADGSVVRVNKDSDPELLWGLRGAGAALGVVAELTLRLHDVTSAYSGMLMFPDDPEHNNLKSIIKWMHSVACKEPDFTNNCLRGLAPSGDPIVAVFGAHLGPLSKEEKAAFLAPLRALGPIVDTWGQMSYMETQLATRPMLEAAPPHYEYWASGQLRIDQVTDATFEDLAAMASDVPDNMPVSNVIMEVMRGHPDQQEVARARNPNFCEGPNGLSSDSQIGWVLQLGFLDASLADEARALGHKWKSRMGAYGSIETYSNFKFIENTPDPDSELAMRAGGADNLVRLRALKARVDPSNVFKAHAFKGL